MKSSSSSPSSSTTYSDGGLRNSNDDAAGCLAGILRRLLCGNVSSRSSDHSKEAVGEDTTNCQDRREEEKFKPASPSIVARLMGLDSMPEFGSIPSVRNPDSIGRSRSVNSLNNWLEFDPTQRLHRRIRASLSFREIPTFLREENQDFILLCFGSDDGEKPVLSKSKELKSEMGFGELKEKRREICRSKGKEKQRENRGEKKDQGSDRRVSRRKNSLEMRIERRASRKTSNSVETRGTMPPSKRGIYTKHCLVSKIEKSSKPTNSKEIADIMKLTKEREGDSLEKTVESNCSSENSSPVSVLESPFDTDNDFLNDSETPIISDDSMVIPVNSRRKLSLVTGNSNCVSSHVSHISASNDKELKPTSNEDGERRKKRSNLLSCSDIWREVCLMAGEDIKQLSWALMNLSKMEDVEEIGIEFVGQILDCLVHETIAELAELPPKIYEV